MKFKLLFTVLFLAMINLQILAQTQSLQSPLVGTWIFEDKQGGTKEMKIITPTHVSFIVMDTKKDSIMYAGFGSYAIQNGKYVETMEISNVQMDKSKSLAFDYKVEVNKLYQTGSVTFADGRVQSVKNVFTKANLPAQDLQSIVGTWKMVSFKSERKGGTTDDTKLNFMRIINSTHWMDIAQTVDGYFAHAAGGTYTIQAGKLIAVGTFPANSNQRVEANAQVEGDKLTITGLYYQADGSSHKITDLFQKVNSKTAKTVSTK